MKPIHFSIVSIISMFFLMVFGCCKEENINCPTCPSPPTDTTSHNFVWDTPIYFGTSGSSTLYDVAIINDTLAYAVGAIYLTDTITGQPDPQPYNLAVWDGNTWRLQRLNYQNYPPAIKSIFSFNENDIWFDTWFHWDGQSFQEIMIDPIFNGVGVKKMWGNPNGDLYVVGNNGFIGHRNTNSVWQTIESGTSLSINDIWGAYNSITKQWEILAVAADIGSSSDRKILQIKGTSVTTLLDSPIAWSLSGVWFVPCLHYYVVGSGIYKKRLLSENAWLNNPQDITTYYTTAIRGNTYNDLFVVGAFGEVVHFNGSSWYSYQNTTALANGAYSGIAMIGNLVIVVGAEGPTAVVAIGRRQ